MPSVTSSSSLRMKPPTRIPYARVRSIHANGGHVAHKNMPFSYQNRVAWRNKYIAFISTGFIIPFVAVYWQLWKSSSST